MKMEDIGKLNKLYNFQDTIILCEICDTRANFLNEKNITFANVVRQVLLMVAYIMIKVNVVLLFQQAQKLSNVLRKR